MHCYFVLIAQVFAYLLFLLFPLAPIHSLLAEEKVLIAYGGHNETVVPMWLAVEKGLFKRHGLEVRMLQVRSGQIIMSTLASGGVQAVWPAPSSVLNAAAGGLKIQCVASGSNKIPRELVVQKEIRSIDDLRGKIFGVQSIGGGMWLRAMIVLESLGVNPEKHALKLRVVGEDATITQALITGNIDAAILPYSFSSLVKRAGLRSLADTADLKAAFQGSTLCLQKSTTESSPDLVQRLVKGLAEALALVLDPSHKPDVMEIIRRNLRFSKAEDMEASYKVLRLMTTLDVAPNVDAWRAMQRLVSRLNAKVGQVELDQVLNGTYVRSLEESGFLPDVRKRLQR
ncbi:MAG: ABC transporter substrate-binding protein [Deltaproteobacteria bacterium]|nr:ABC transporter substrate-binding protein [Deltaproteobacteria bacterium]